MYDILELSKKLLPELKDIAKELNIKKAESLKKQDLIYKILDQQAIETTETKPVIKPEKEKTRSPLDMSKDDFESARRRGKRPRTLKPVVNRPVESVISVSPDDLKKPDTRPSDWQDHSKKSEKDEEKSDLTKTEEPVREDRKPSKWTNDRRSDDWREKGRI